jgi:hypothetical protein
MSKLFSSVWVFTFGLIINTSAVSATAKEEFQRVNRIVLESYSEEVAKLNAKVDLKEIFENYGGAFQVDSAHKPFGENRYIITLTGAVVKGPDISPGHAVWACHEMGHLFGGAPFQKRALVSWSSVEGQADYAVSECMWRYIENVQSRIFIHEYEAAWINKCEEHFEGEKRVLGCLRILSGFQAVVNYFNMDKDPEEHVSLDKKETAVATKTLEKFASNQCRVDTWMAGLFNEPRPACWYREST